MTRVVDAVRALAEFAWAVAFLAEVAHANVAAVETLTITAIAIGVTAAPAVRSAWRGFATVGALGIVPAHDLLYIQWFISSVRKRTSL